MWHYSDLLKVNRDFIDVFSAEADRQRAEAWRGFIPHKAMENLLSSLVQSLERGKPRSLWMHGSYGTGKTYCLFLLKHMLEDPWPAVESYFRAHKLSPDLRKRVGALRDQGPGKIVFLSGSGHVNSNLKFLATIEQSVKEALRRDADLESSALATPTLLESVVAKLTDPNSLFGWHRAFEQHRAEFEPYADSAEKVVSWLSDPAANPSARTHLLGLVAQIMEQHGFVVLDSAESVKLWLKELVQTLRLPWIVIIWDEFTEFFLNGAPLDGLQGLAELSYEAPVYVLIATHRSPEIMPSTRTDRWRKLQDRFVVCPYQMEAVTTYRLMANVVHIDPELEPQWEDQQSSLWDRVSFTARNLTREDGRHKDLKSLVPLHPYAAYLLSTLSDASLSAANRTLFQFLKGESEHGYPRFLQQHPTDDWAWYTADGLWDYFFDPDNVDLAEDFRDAMNYYHSRSGDITDPDATRVFKAIMLLVALQRAIAGEPRLEPTLSNLAGMFSGTRIEPEIQRLTTELCGHDLVREVPGTTQERRQFTIPRGGVDITAVRAIKRSLPGFRRQLEASGELRRQISPPLALSGALQRRYAVAIVSFDELRARRERVAPPVNPFEIGVVWIVPLNAEEQREAARVAADLAGKDERIIYALLEEPFGEERFEMYLDDLAYCQYYTTKVDDRQNAQYHRTRADGRVRSWLETLRTTTIHIFVGGSPRMVSGVPAFGETFADIVRQSFPYAPERITQAAPLYKESFGPTGAEVGLGLRESSAEYNVFIQSIKAEGLWPGTTTLDRTRLDTRPNHPLARMAHDVVDRALAADAVSLSGLWAELQERPFGLLPSPISIALMGLLLRDARDGFYYDDGTNVRPLDGTKLAELLNQVIKGKASYTLYRTSPAAKAFCEHLSAIFRLHGVEQYPETVRAGVRTWLKRVGLPLWALDYHLKADGRTPLDSVKLLHSVVSSTELSDAVFTQGNLERVSHALEEDHHIWDSLVTRTQFEQGMRFYVDTKLPSLLPLAERLGTGLGGVLERVHELLNEEVWLWQEDDVAEPLSRVESELLLVEALNRVTGGAASELDAAVSDLGRVIGVGKLPLFVLSEHEDPDTATVIRSLDQLLHSGKGYPHAHRLAKALSASSERVQEALRIPVQALANWVHRHLKQHLADDDVEAVYSAMRDLSDALGEEEVRREVTHVLEALKSRRLAQQLQAQWFEVTGSESPDDWSKSHGVPIGWLLDSTEWSDLLSIIRNPFTSSVRRLEWAIEYLSAQDATLSERLDGRFADEVLVRTATGDFRRLVQDDADVRDLRQHLCNHAGADVRQWERRRIEDLGREWVRRAYGERMYPRVVAQVDATPEEELRALLTHLVRHPSVGLLLMGRRN